MIKAHEGPSRVNAQGARRRAWTYGGRSSKIPEVSRRPHGQFKRAEVGPRLFHNGAVGRARARRCGGGGGGGGGGKLRT